MKEEHPIIFSQDMVKAILDGRKTQTRRVIKIPYKMQRLGWTNPPTGPLSPPIGWCRYGQPGTVMWVREKYASVGHYYCYAAGQVDVLLQPVVKWKAATYMPRVAARILLRIDDIRAERLQDISDEDTIAEGCVTTFKKLWVEIKGRESWKQNPWVWVISFERILP